MKKSFVLYNDQYDAVADLTTEQKGELFDLLFLYSRGEAHDDIERDPMVKLAFKFFKTTIDRDTKKWVKVAERNRVNGAKGGRPSKNSGLPNNPKQPKKPSGLSGNPKNPEEPKKAVSGSVSGSDSVSGECKDISPEIKNFVADYQKYISETFGPSAPKVTDSLISKASDTIDKLIRLDGFTYTDISNAIKWASTDQFWGPQIKSLAGLRAKSKNQLTKFQNLFDSFKRKSFSTGSKITDTNIASVREFLNG